MKRLLLAVAIICLTCQGRPSLAQTTSNQTAAAQKVVTQYHSGLTAGDAKKVRLALSDELIMFNGNHSDDPAQWQAHLYLSGQSLARWLAEFLKVAGPHKNELQFLHTSVRGNAALVVTQETGSNKFRRWQDEKVAYLLGMKSGQWRLVGLFIRDIKNPE